MTLADKPKNTKYYINSAIGVSIMLFFGYLPTFSTVTPIGMKILGIYLGLLYLWSTVDLIWPSLLGIIITGFSGYDSVSGILASGFGDGTFRPNDALTRAQAAVMLCAFAAFTQDDVTVRADLSAYSDAGQIPSWAMDAMQWANARQLIIGRDSAHLAPTAATTRAEMASILSAYIRK